MLCVLTTFQGCLVYNLLKETGKLETGTQMSKLCFVKVTCQLERHKNKSHHLTCPTSSMYLYTSQSHHQVKAAPWLFPGTLTHRRAQNWTLYHPNTGNPISGVGSYTETAESSKRRIQDLSPPIQRRRTWKMLFHFWRLTCKEAVIKV